ncbi:V-set and transmembrane domain-containing protein 1 isoform X5 [Rousettus aegyptiacus]|uniref:V-set and transmembrane domain-containing protein 1 isoform X5 n=1 Tax=Rousettus aegyptiacus TaxID=9407 RepID=UPI0007878688|nr:V-set and transmembrane domain-containing protein 1 isoform X5 [Rousettus aegyptiacus]
MITGFLSLFCLGLCLGYQYEQKNEKLPKPSLNALPGFMVERGSNVTLKCQCQLQNVTFMLGKMQDSGYKEERSSAGHDAEFFLADLEPKDAGMYFCVYKTIGSHEWSEKSEYLQLVVTDDHDGPGASSVKTDALSMVHHMKNPPREPGIPDFPSRRLQICPTRKVYRFRTQRFIDSLFKSKQIKDYQKTEDPQEVTYADHQGTIDSNFCPH